MNWYYQCLHFTDKETGNKEMDLTKVTETIVSFKSRNSDSVTILITLPTKEA